MVHHLEMEVLELIYYLEKMIIIVLIIGENDNFLYPILLKIYT